MNYKGKVTLNAPQSKVWDTVLDVNEFSACMPGVTDLVLVDESTFTGAMKANVGPINGDFKFTARITDSTAPSELTAEVEGIDSLTKSTMTSTIHMSLSTADGAEATDLAYQANVNIKGRLGIIGDMVLRATGAQVINEFFKRLRARVE
jgi:carbon monoxide dehydrogenase subunit G